MIRSDDEAYYETMRDRFRALCEAAAPATGTTVEVTFSGRASTMNNNPVLAERFRANMAAYGIADQGDDENAGSTDMANVSWVCPTIHPDLAIAPEGTPGHSILFRDAAAIAAGRRDRRSSQRRSSRRPPTSCSRTRSWSRPPGGPSADVAPLAGATIAPRAPLDDGFEPAAPPARRIA